FPVGARYITVGLHAEAREIVPGLPVGPPASTGIPTYFGSGERQAWMGRLRPLLSRSTAGAVIWCCASAWATRVRPGAGPARPRCRRTSESSPIVNHDEAAGFIAVAEERLLRWWRCWRPPRRGCRPRARRWCPSTPGCARRTTGRIVPGEGVGRRLERGG